MIIKPEVPSIPATRRPAIGRRWSVPLSNRHTSHPRPSYSCEKVSPHHGILPVVRFERQGVSPEVTIHDPPTPPTRGLYKMLVTSLFQLPLALRFASLMIIPTLHFAALSPTLDSGKTILTEREEKATPRQTI